MLSSDRISELPDSILLHILSFFPAKDVVYTACLLSKRWIHLRPFLHSLIFIEPTIVRNPEPKPIIDHHHGYNQHVHSIAYVYSYAGYPRAPSPSNDNWSALVDATLISYDFCYVERFCIQCHYDPAYITHQRRLLQVDSWVNYAVRRKSVKQLELIFLLTGTKEQYCLPRILFGNETLTSLSLISSLFRDCVSTITWMSLKSLSMEDITFRGLHIWKKIIVGCPVLECLKLIRCDGTTCLEIEIVSHSLKVLVLDHCHFQVKKFRVSTANLSVLVVSGLMWYIECTIEIDIGLCLTEATFKEKPINQQHHTSTSMYDINV